MFHKWHLHFGSELTIIFVFEFIWSPALSDSEGITDGSVSEARGEVDRNVLVPLLKPGGEEHEETVMWKAEVSFRITNSGWRTCCISWHSEGNPSWWRRSCSSSAWPPHRWGYGHGWTPENGHIESPIRLYLLLAKWLSRLIKQPKFIEIVITTPPSSIKQVPFITNKTALNTTNINNVETSYSVYSMHRK